MLGKKALTLSLASLEFQNMLVFFESMFPELAAYLKQLRASLGVQNRTDQLQLSAEIIAIYNFLYEHNYIQFLVMTGNFVRLREYYDEFSNTTQKIMVNYLEEEYVKPKATQQIPPPPTKPSISTESSINNSPIVYTQLSNMDLLYCLDSIQKQETYKYTKIQTKIYADASDKRIENLNNVITSLQKDKTSADNPETARFLEDAQKLHTSLTKKQNEIAVLEKKLEKSPQNQDIADQLLTAKKELFEQTEEIKVLLENPKNPDIDIIKNGLIADNEITKKASIELAKAKTDYEEISKKIQSHKNVAQKAAKADIDSSFEIILQQASQAKIDELPSEQKIALNEAINELTAHRQKISTAENYDELQALLGKSNENIAVIKSLTSDIAILPKEKYDLLVKEAEKLEGAVITIDSKDLEIVLTLVKKEKQSAVKNELDNLRTFPTKDLINTTDDIQQEFKEKLVELSEEQNKTNPELRELQNVIQILLQQLQNKKVDPTSLLILYQNLDKISDTTLALEVQSYLIDTFDTINFNNGNSYKP